ncbi:hypothetical protein ACWFPY_09065 [Nocardia fluminea]
MIEVLKSSSHFHEVVDRQDPALIVLFHRQRDPNSTQTRLAYQEIVETCCTLVTWATMEFDDWSRVVEEFKITSLPTAL